MLKVDSTLLSVMEDYYHFGRTLDSIPDRAKKLFPALKVAVFPSYWHIDYRSKGAVRTCFNHPGLNIVCQ